MITTKEAVDKIIYELETDKDYYYMWQANIAMAYIDNEAWYKQKTKKKFLNHEDKHVIANNAAKYFLDILIKTNK